MANKTKTKLIRARVDLLEKARKVFAENSTGNVRLGDLDLTSAALAVFIAHCEGKTMPLEVVQEKVNKAVVHGIATTLRCLGNNVDSVVLTSEGFVAKVVNGEDITVSGNFESLKVN